MPWVTVCDLERRRTATATIDLDIRCVAVYVVNRDVAN